MYLCILHWWCTISELVSLRLKVIFYSIQVTDTDWINYYIHYLDLFNRTTYECNEIPFNLLQITGAHCFKALFPDFTWTLQHQLLLSSHTCQVPKKAWSTPLQQQHCNPHVCTVQIAQMFHIFYLLCNSSFTYSIL